MILLWKTHFYLGGQSVSNKAALAALRLYNYFLLIGIVVLIGNKYDDADDDDDDDDDDFLLV